MWWQTMVIAGLALAVGYLAGVQRPAGETPMHDAMAGAQQAYPDALSARLRAEVGDELDVRFQAMQSQLCELRVAGADHQVTGAGDPGFSEPSPAPAVAVNSYAFEQARELVDERVAFGVWTEEDRRALRSTLQDLSPAQADAVMAAFFGAVNDGSLDLQTGGPPL